MTIIGDDEILATSMRNTCWAFAITTASDAGHFGAQSCLVECYVKARGAKNDVMRTSELLRRVGLHA
jgi:hypothetical protein